jgi:hypothetical protein
MKPQRNTLNPPVDHKRQTNIILKNKHKEHQEGTKVTKIKTIIKTLCPLWYLRVLCLPRKVWRSQSGTGWLFLTLPKPYIEENQ